MKKGFLAVLAGVAAVCGHAAAQDEAVEDGAYIRFGFGATFLSDQGRDFNYPPGMESLVALPEGAVTDYSTGKTFGAALGFDYADGIRTELEYRFADSPADTVTQVGGLADGDLSPADGDMKAHLLMTNFYFDFANSSPLTPFIGGGVGGAFVTNELEQRDAALAYQGKAGVSLAMGTGLSADLEYIYLRSNKLDFTPADSFVTDDRYQSSSVMVSMRKRF